MTSRQRSANCKIIAVVIVNSYELPNSADHQLRNIAGVKYLKADHSKDQFQEISQYIRDWKMQIFEQ
jgi:hypothetical protein